MIDRPRSHLLTAAAVCLILFGVLAWMVTGDRSALDGVDVLGQRAEAWADDFPALQVALRGIEDAFGTIGMTLLTIAVAAALLVKNQRRAAGYLVAVMLTTTALTTAFKALFSRARPHWQDPVDLLESLSFPSGHASSAAAFTGVLAVLAAMFLRRAGMRRAAVAGLTLLWLLICADRVLLGRHFPTDVVGGSLLGAAVVLLGIVVLNPAPRSHALAAAPLTESVPGARDLHVVLNPSKVEDRGQFESIVTSMALEAGWSTPTWHYTTVEDSGTSMAEAAAIAGADLVLVCGGDGTVREVCAELAGTGVPVGIIPAGTGNLLARNLGIPLYLRSAIDVALTGQDRAIDLVAVTGDGFDPSHFLVMAGMGFDAAIMEGVNEDIKARVGWVAYVLSGMKSLMFPAVKVEITIDDGEPTKHRARTIVVGNVGFLQAGLPLLPDAAIDDGSIDVVLLHPQRLGSWIPLAWRVLARRPHTDETINRMTGRRVVVRAASDTPRQLDGDSIGSGRELVMECIHGRLLVRVPR